MFGAGRLIDQDFFKGSMDGDFHFHFLGKGVCLLKRKKKSKLVHVLVSFRFSVLKFGLVGISFVLYEIVNLGGGWLVNARVK